MRPGITIVIPNWNHEFVLPRSISSALNAVRELRSCQIDADILVLDDHSRDGSMPLLLQLEALYGYDGLKVVAFDVNQGVVALRNFALKEARFQYILFLDADNALFPKNLSIFYRAIQQTNAAVVYGNVVRHGPQSTYFDLFNNEVVQQHIFQQNYIDMFGLYDRLQLADTGGLTEHPLMGGHEDWELILHLAVSGRRLVFVPIMMGIYYEMPGSRVSPFHTKEAKEQRQEYIERVFDQLQIRQKQMMRTLQLRYHPDIGYL